MYKIENTASDIKLQHPGKIEPRFLADDSTVKIKGIILNKPYKLQITAVGKVNGAKKKRVRSVEYSSTLINALTNAKALRVKWIEELKNEIKTSAVPTELQDKLKALRNPTNLDNLQSAVDDTLKALQSSSPAEIPELAVKLAEVTQKLEIVKQKQLQDIKDLETKVRVAESNTDAITEMMTLNEAFERYIEYQQIKYSSKKVKKPFDESRYRGIYEKHIKKALGNTLLDNIDKEDIQKITNGMVVHRAKLDDNGRKIPQIDEDGKHQRYVVNKVRNNGSISRGNHGHLMYEMETRSAAERTKRSIYTLVNPIYTYINSSNKIKYNIPSPASMEGLEPLENEKEVTETIEGFTKLYNYKHEHYQKVFVWLMHGRRFGEVSSLDYKDINLEEGTYTIKAINNKAKVDMTYNLTKWQLATLSENDPKSGLVFSSMNSSTKQLNSGTITSNHWILNCTMHDVRHIIGNTLVSKGVSIEIIGRILGHKPKKNIITNRYSKVSAKAADEALYDMLEGVLV